jgi:ketosteroid isomerase-like protein
VGQFQLRVKEVSMFRFLRQALPGIALLSLLPARSPGQEPTPAVAAKATAEVRDAIRRYDAALLKADAAAAEQFWATEYFFVNPRGERLTRADRVANLRSGRTAVDSVVHAPQEEQFRAYGNGDIVVYTALLTLGARYSGQAAQGKYRAMVVWVRRDGRWQQVASQLTPIAGQ